MTPDITRDAALLEYGTRLERMVHGRLVLVCEKHDGHVADWWIDDDDLIQGDYDRIMREKPKGWRR